VEARQHQCDHDAPGAVVGAVVGQDPLDGDAPGGEEADRSAVEADGGDGLLILEDLGVDDPVAVVEGGVQVAVAGAGVASVLAGPSAVEPPAAAWRMAASFFTSR